MDIGSKCPYPSSALSNFALHFFVFDGVWCASMEGFLQALKYEDQATQHEVCMLVGIKAKKRGTERNDAWQSQQTLWWNGVPYDRHGSEYQELLDRAYDALAENVEFQRALRATGDAVLTHTIGWHNARETVLTEQEFCSRLERLRDQLRSDGR